MVSTAFPPPLGSVGKKEEVMHFEFEYLVDEMADGGAFAERVGTVMNCTMSWRLVVEHHERIDTWEIVCTRHPSLVERVQIRLKSVYKCEY